MKKILLIDDDKNLCQLLSSYLFSCNFSVQSVCNTRSALVLIKEEQPDLVIADIMMQDLNGYDFIKLLNLNDSFIYIPVIFLTAKGMTNDRIKGYNLGCYAYLIKPFDPQELVAIINSILGHVDLLTKASILLSKPEKLLLSERPYNDLYFTAREKSVLKFILKGYMNKEIAIILNTSLRNVEKYVTRILRKTHARNRVHLIRLFM
uniref:TctD-like protein n=1 Tax=Leptosiphonia brodiei TaxID=2608611 RepID=A0A1Z1MAI1_9FLOR|nr:hypothetical protein [Leptosiphonia brodiei]ARW62996.1 hypothetical protein [Leptosiphonia brodiei]